MALTLLEKLISDWVYDTYKESQRQNMIGYSGTNLLARVQPYGSYFLNVHLP